MLIVFISSITFNVDTHDTGLFNLVVSETCKSAVRILVPIPKQPFACNITFANYYSVKM